MTIPETHTPPEGATSATPPADGKLYRWDGQQFQEMVFEKTGDRRVPITEDAFQAALAVRVEVQKKIRMRPDISIVISAMVKHASEDPDIVDTVADYGLQLYALRQKEKAEAKAAAKAARAREREEQAGE